MILKQGHTYRAMPHDGKVIRRIYRGGRCYYIASPYSPEATQALKAAFPQYWTAIRDYGFAHPQLVPFINEDPMLIVSLVEVGKERWLVGDGKAKIITDVVPSANTGVKVLLKKISSVHNSFAFSAGTLNDRYGVYDQGNILLYWYYPNGYKSTGVSYSNTLLIEYNIDSIISIKDISGNELYGATLNQIDCSGVLQTGSSTTYPNGVDSYQYMIAETDGVENFHGVPFTRNGENGMLDILSGTFYPNANTEGTFTIEITDKA